MYYGSPEADEAYSFAKTQYMFGSDMVVAPIAGPASHPTSGTAAQTVWLPEGTWSDWWTNKTHTGPTTVTQSYTHADGVSPALPCPARPFLECR